MEQPNRILIHGLAFVRMSDGTLFPVLAGGDSGGGSSSYETPDPVLARQQREMNDLQLENARRSRLLEPMLLERAGLRLNPKTGQYVDIDPELTGNRRLIERMQTERSLKALKGELPVSKTLQREFEVGQQQLDEKLNRQGGSGAKHSTSGVLQQESFDRNRMALQEAEQRDMLTTAEALSLSRQNNRANEAVQIENPFAAQARALQPAQQSIYAARDQDNFSRNMRYQGSMARQQSQDGYVSGGMGLAATALMAMAMMSDPEMKYDIEPVSDAALLKSLRKMPVSKWKYKHDRSEHIGAMADTMPEEVSNGKSFDLVSYLGLLTGSIRELDRMVRGEDELTPAMALIG